jgi:hypothetical protein
VFPYITKQLIARELLPAYELELFGIGDLFTEMETTRTDYETIAGMRAVTLLPRVRPGQNFPTANWGEKNIQVEVAKFGEILEIEKELVISDQTGQILSRAREAGTMMGAHRHRFMVETICDGARDALEETSSTSFMYDKSARTVYATTHTTVDGVANSNLSATTDLDTEGLDAVYTLLGQMTDEKGRYITVMPKAILVHPSQFPTAWQFTAGLEQPDTAERGLNFYKSQLKLTPYQSPYVYSSAGSRAATDFYMGDFTRQMVWMWVIRPTVDNEGATSSASFERDVIARYKFHYFGGAGMKDYRFIVKATK